MFTPLEGRKVVNRTPREDAGWNHYTIEWFSLELLTGDSGWNLSQIVLHLIVYDAS